MRCFIPLYHKRQPERYLGMVVRLAIPVVRGA
jgi:hypothetical protein